MNKSLSSIVCLLVVMALAFGSSEARPKRSIVYTAAVPTAVVASVPVVQHSHVVHTNPTTVVKTEQVQSGNHARYSYSQEVQTHPVVHTHQTHAVAAVPVATHAAVAALPAAHYGYYPYSYYSPYSYVVGK